MFKLIRNDKKKGFTLVELIVVIAILAVLALILIPAITGYVNRANTSKNEANARALYTKAMLLATDADATKEGIEAELAGDLEAGDTVIVTMNTDGTVSSVTYTPDKGDPVTMP